jgi:hypothetical protein
MRNHEQKYGFIVPPPPHWHWTWHLRWVLPTGLLFVILAMLPQWSPAMIDPRDVGVCVPAMPK